MIILQQILLEISFLLIIFITVVLPGFAVIKKTNLELDDLEQFSIASVLGMVLFTLCAYVLAWLNLRILMYIFPICGILSFFKYRKDIFKFRLGIKHKKLFLLVAILGIIGQVAVNATSGLPYKDGIYFWSSHGHDGVWHLALMEQMHKIQFPFQNPELAGTKLQNYHFFVDLFMSEVTRIFPYSNLDVYFRFMPIFFSLLLGLGGFIFVRLWSKSEIAGIWSMIFIYFCGSFGYLLNFPRSLGGESTFWVSQTQSVLGNPPHAAAFIISTTFLFSLLKYLNTRSFLFFLLCAILGGVVIEFKVYAGVLILGGLLVLGIFEFLFKKIYSTILLFIVTLIIALIIYLPNSVNSQDFLIWQPWWFIRTMIVAPDRLNWLDLELRRQTYIAEHNWKRVILVETTAFLIFLIGNLGMRVIGFWGLYKQIRENIFKNSFNLFFLITTSTSFLIPVFFLQKGVAWNAIQFNQYFLLFFGFLAAISITEFLKIFKTKSSKYIISFIIILLAIPTQIGLLWQFYSNKPLSKVSFEELEGLNYLKNHSAKEDIVLVAPFNKYERNKYKDPPIPIYTWYDTGYVSVFSGRRTLVSDEEQVNIMGYDVSNLLKEREEAFQSSDYQLMNNLFKKYNISYIYLVLGQKFATDSANLNAELIFRNKEVALYKVKHEKN